MWLHVKLLHTQRTVHRGALSPEVTPWARQGRGGADSDGAAGTARDPPPEPHPPLPHFSCRETRALGPTSLPSTLAGCALREWVALHSRCGFSALRDRLPAVPTVRGSTPCCASVLFLLTGSRVRQTAVCLTSDQDPGWSRFLLTGDGAVDTHVQVLCDREFLFLWEKCPSVAAGSHAFTFRFARQWRSFPERLGSSVPGGEASRSPQPARAPGGHVSPPMLAGCLLVLSDP